MNYLALDIGMRRTGVAFSSSETGVPVALDTIKSKDNESLIKEVKLLVDERQIGEVICGLPLLLSGEEGKQCEYVHSITDLLTELGIKIHLLDERYTTPNLTEIDGDASAACQLLLTFLEREKRSV